MKRLLIALLIIGSWHSYAQDPDFYRTWYLNELQVTDLDPIFIISEFDPPILPTLTIEPNLDFSGDGACNTFSGSWDYDGENFNAITFQNGTEDCGTSDLNIFEQDYFDMLNGPFYIWEIVPDGEGLKLEVYTLLLGYAIFRDYILPVDDFMQRGISIYPNPVSEELFISSEGNQIDGLSVYSISGQQLISKTGETNSLDVSSLSEGIYFLELLSEGRKQFQKFIKN